MQNYLPPRRAPTVASKPGLGLTLQELKDIGSEPRNYLDAAHWAANELLERRDARKAAAAAAAAAKTPGAKIPIPPRGLLTKILGTPLHLAKDAAEGAYILSSEERRRRNRQEMIDLANTSVTNRALSGVLNTPQNLIGASQIGGDMLASQANARASEAAYQQMKAGHDQRMAAILARKNQVTNR